MAIRKRASGSAKSEAIDIDGDDGVSMFDNPSRSNFKAEEEDDIIHKFNLIDLTDDDGLDSPDYLREITPRFVRDASQSLPFGHRELNSTSSSFGRFVQIDSFLELVDGDFLLVKQISRRSSTGNSVIRGLLFRRNRRVDDMLPKRCNEICMMLKADVRYAQKAGVRNAQKLSPDECLVTRDISAAAFVRQLICTNRPFPALSFRETHFFPTLNEAAEFGVLICRWKHVEFYDRNKIREQMLCRLTEEDCTPRKAMPDFLLTRNWCGDTKTKAEVKEAKSAEDFMDLTADEPRQSRRKKSPHYKKATSNAIDLTADSDEEYEVETTETSFKKITFINKRSVTKHEESSTVSTKRRASLGGSRSANGRRSSTKAESKAHVNYTYGEVCAGAGGMTSGAHRAKFKLKFLLDHWLDACNTLKLNFTDAKVLFVNIFDFCQIANDSIFRVDVLHISFPCQPHSAVHTIPGKNDEANTAAGYSVIPILQKCRPRIVTFEQTSGMITHNGGWHFRALIHQLTAIGYSARWKIVNMAEYGNVQARKRLIIIAAAPGEILPPFPKATHGNGYNLEPFTTIHDVLSNVPRNIPAHMQQYSPKPHGRAYNPNQPLAQAITTGGGLSDTHPNGDRSFNMQELAQLGGFPPTHKFGNTNKTSIRKQIGNAVPSCFAEILFKEITASLRTSDRRAAAYKPEVVELD